MQNIDPVLFLEPVMAVLMSAAGIIYWRRRRGFKRALLLLALVAYAGAIMAKVAIQAASFPAAQSFFGPASLGLGLYFGLQTVFLEVGLAYLVASLSVKRAVAGASDGVGYGLSLAFWENGVLLGALPILNLTVTYMLIASGSSLGQTVYTTVYNADPTYFQPPSVILWSVLLGTLERLSSMLIHVAWGVLVVLAAASGRKRYLAYALPMGLVDALVPFASLNMNLFEAGIFLISLGCVAVAWLSLRQSSALLTAGPGSQTAPVSAAGAFSVSPQGTRSARQSYRSESTAEHSC